MNPIPPLQRLPGVLVPGALVNDRAKFGGTRVGDSQHGDLILRDGFVAGLAPPTTAEVRHLVMPRLTEVHVHLDKCHTVDRIPDVGGNLRSAIAAQAKDLALWTVEDLRSRISRGLGECVAAGCGAIRSHVDWGADPTPPLAWEVMDELAADLPSGVVLQRAAFTSIDQMSDAEWAMSCARRVARDGGVLGAFVFDQPDRRRGILHAIRLAERFGLALDFHVDEGLDSNLDGTESIADAVLEANFEGPVLLGHACALANLAESDLSRVAGKLARAEIAVAVLPHTNLYLQGRRHGTPDRRGLTRLHELRAAGVNVVLGTDNVRDAFCPIGCHDPLRVLGFSVLAAHLDPPFDVHLSMITTAARRALGFAPIHVDTASVHELIAFEAQSTSGLLAALPRPRPLSELLEGAAS